MTDINLYQGSCTNLLANIPDGSIDAIINDPPYGTTQCSWDSELDMAVLWPEYLRVLKPEGVIVLFSAQPFTSKLIMSYPTLFRYIWYWEKERGTNFLNVKRQPLRVIEEICIFAPTSKYTYNAQMVPLDKPYTHTIPIKKSAITKEMGSQKSQTLGERQYKTYTHTHPKNLLSYARDNAGKSLVPTQKPVALMEYLIQTYTNPGDIVLDPTMGSGTTGVAAKQLGRSFVGMELDPKHFAIARSRIDGAATHITANNAVDSTVDTTSVSVGTPVEDDIFSFGGPKSDD